MNRIIGILFTIIALAAIILAAMNYGNYRSLCFTDNTPSEEAVEVITADSLTTPEYEFPAIEEYETVAPYDANSEIIADSTAVTEERRERYE